MIPGAVIGSAQRSGTPCIEEPRRPRRSAKPSPPALLPATWPREDPLAERLLCVDPGTGIYRDALVRDLPDLLHAGDLLVVNDAATLPASLAGTTAAGRPVEVRLLRALPDAAGGDAAWSAVLFGAGDWRTPTERRPPPELLERGEALRFGPDLAAVVSAVSELSPRLVELRFDRQGAALWSALYRHGRPVQYAYLRGPLDLWLVQTAYGARPWAAEQPSAGRPLRWGVLLELRRRGVGLAALTHGAGLSSTGDVLLDRALPLAEAYDIPQGTVAAVAAARARGGRVIAVGTTVVRALEGCAQRHGGALRAGPGETELRLSADSRLLVVDGLLTGMHEPSASHFDLLQAFVRRPVLEAAYDHAAQAGYLCHEFGDSNLILPF